MKCAVVFLDNVSLDVSDGNVCIEPILLKENLTFGSPYEVTSKVRGYEALGIDNFVYYASIIPDIEVQKRSL